jgi:hypothetical protein
MAVASDTVPVDCAVTAEAPAHRNTAALSVNVVTLFMTFSRYK